MNTSQNVKAQTLGIELLQECARIDADAAKVYRLVRQGADVLLFDSSGSTAQDLAARNKRSDLVNLLAQNNAMQTSSHSNTSGVSLYQQFANAKQIQEDRRQQLINDTLAAVATQLEIDVALNGVKPHGIDPVSRHMRTTSGEGLHLVSFAANSRGKYPDDKRKFVAVQTITVSDVRSSPAYLKLLEAAAAPNVDMAVELVEGPVFHIAETSISAFIFTDRKFSQSSDAGLLAASQTSFAVPVVSALPSTCSVKPMRPLKLKQGQAKP